MAGWPWRVLEKVVGRLVGQVVGRLVGQGVGRLVERPLKALGKTAEKYLLFS